MNELINFDTASFKEFENILQYDMMDMTSRELKNKNVDIRTISSIMVAGIYYLVLHAKYTESTFCEIELNEEGFNRIRSSIKDILNWGYEEDPSI